MALRNKHMVEFIKDREREDQRQQQLEQMRQENLMKRKTMWEVRTNGFIERTQIEREMKKLREQSKQSLNERRAALARLIDFEDRQYKEEIVASQPTMEDRKHDLIQQAMALKEERETMRRKEADEAYERQFRLQSDELRTKTSKLRCWKIAHGGRLDQLEEHRIRSEQEKTEEQYWADQWDKDRLRKVERERVDQEDIEMRNKEMRRLLDIQSRDNSMLREEDNARVHGTDRALLEHWSEERRAYDEKERQKREEIRRSLLKNHDYNETIITRQKGEFAKEKEDDRSMMKSLLAKEREQLDREDAAQRRLNQECRETYELCLQQIDEEGEDLRQRDRHIDEVRKQVQAKEDAEWDRQRQYRQSLLREVLHERDGQLVEKRERIRAAKDWEMNFARGMKERIAKEEAEEEEKQRQIYQKNLQLQGVQRKQMEHDADRENHEKQYDLAVYKRMLQEEKRYKGEEERILRDDVPEDVYHGVKHINFYT